MREQRTGADRLVRCAIYTRKSTEEGLEQNFNSLDAQREACAAYILSQRHEGWVAVADIYDDGGYSGGNMERPGIKMLLADIALGKVDVIVVYKVDRLTRSLADFAKIVEVLDAKGASFVSVTQSFNTTTSMGRLTLNVLLSFAQFEREVTGERIRDKIAASKATGATAGASAPPARDVGLFARRNLDGWQERRMDLAKVHREVGHWAPSWHGSGPHYVGRSIEAYPVDNHPARLLTITTTVLEQLDGAFVVRLRVDQPLLRTAPNFVENLKFNLTLLREFCGLASIYPADMTDSEYARVQQVDWELLPPGSLPRMIEVIKSKSAAHPHRAEVAVARLQNLDRLKSDGFIQGTGKFSSYFGAKFGPRLVALENLEYGNALYVFEDEWERLSQISRTELVKRRDDNVHRIPHVPGWGSAIRKLVRDTNKSGAA